MNRIKRLLHSAHAIRSRLSGLYGLGPLKTRFPSAFRREFGFVAFVLGCLLIAWSGWQAFFQHDAVATSGHPKTENVRAIVDAVPLDNPTAFPSKSPDELEEVDPNSIAPLEAIFDGQPATAVHALGTEWATEDSRVSQVTFDQSSQQSTSDSGAPGRLPHASGLEIARPITAAAPSDQAGEAAWLTGTIEFFDDETPPDAIVP